MVLSALLPLVIAAVAPPAGWWSPSYPYRLAVQVPASPKPRPAGAVSVSLQYDLAGAASQLVGQPVNVDLDSLVVTDDQNTAAWQARSADGHITWRLVQPPDAATAQRYWLYFKPVGAPAAGPVLPAAQTWGPPPDYATEHDGAPWDLSQIEHFGNRPEYIEHSFADGVLHLKVKVDPYFIWGTMWGEPPAGKRQLEVDLARFGQLEIRLRQSVPDARWTTYGRVGAGEQLLDYDFGVRGTDWQTVRLDLWNIARWRGQLSAFRIDPTNDMEAEVDIASVKLVALLAGQPGELQTLSRADAVPARLQLTGRSNEINTGQELPIEVRATDGNGQPLMGVPVSLRLDEPVNGELLAAPNQSSWGFGAAHRRGLTDAEGRLRALLRGGPRAGERVLEVRAETDFGGPTATWWMSVPPGPPATYAWHPRRPIIMARGQTSTTLTAQLTDANGNPLKLAGRTLTLSGPLGTSLAPAEGVTDAEGRVSTTVTLDPAHCWAAWLDAKDAEGVAGRSAAVCVTPATRDWGVTVGDNGYFVTPDGQAWLPLGGFYANWVGSVPDDDGERGRRLTSFVDTSDAQKTAWLAFLSDQGVTSLRFMLRAHRPQGMEPMDIGGRVNPELYAEALHYMDLARPFGIRFMVTLHEDYDKPVYVNEHHRRTFALPRWDADELAAATPAQQRFVRDGLLVDTPHDRYTEPDAIACQDLYTTELVGLLRDNPQIFSYEFENEMVQVPREWITHQLAVIRAADPRTPVCMSHGGGGLETADPAYWRSVTDIDFYTYHLYPRDNQAQGPDYGLAGATLARYGRRVGRCFLGESVGDEFRAESADPDMRRRVARDLIWFSLAEGNPGCYFWNMRGYEVEEFALARRLTDGLDLARWQPRPLHPGFQAQHPLTDDRYFRTADGQQMHRAMSAAVLDSLTSGRLLDIALGEPLAAAPGAATVAPSAGYEAASWATATGDQGLAYVRNRAGDFEWPVPGSGVKLRLRQPAARPGQLKLSLGAGQYDLVLADLNAKQISQRQIAGDATLDLPATDHDYALTWRRR